MNGQPETHRARSERVPKVAASVPMELGCVALPGCMGSRSWKLSEPHAFGIHGASSHRQDPGLTPRPAPSPLCRMGLGLKVPHS